MDNSIRFKYVLTKFITNYYFLVIILVFILYALLLIFRTSFVIGSTRYFSLFDDEMVSMRYAYNLAHGAGLVWNAGGERIEGITNPLWAFYMAIVHILPISIEKTSLVIQLTGLGLFISTLYYIKKITAYLTNGSKFAIILAVLLTAFYFPLLNWSIIQGTEVSVLTFLLTVSVWLLFKSLQDKKYTTLLFILLGIGIWVRLDFFLPAVILIIMMFLFNKHQKQKIVSNAIPIFLSFVFLQIGMRYWYYHDIVPNTYYLKMTGYPILHRFTRGVYVTLQEFNLVLLMIPVVYTFLTRNKKLFILLTLFITQLFYSMYVGGDAWEFFGGANRYVAIATPLLFITLAYICNQLRQVAHKQFATHLVRYRIAEIFCILFLFFTLNTGSDNMLLYLTMVKQYPTVGENANQTRVAKSLGAITKERESIGIVMAGVTPYFLPNRIFVDLLGKSDRVIAHGESHRDASGLKQYLVYLPGHTKWNYPYIVNHIKPDVFGQVWPDSEVVYLKKDYKKYISKEGYPFYILKNRK